MVDSDYAIANNLLSIEEAYHLAGGTSIGDGKVYCPFGGVFHKDTRVMRIYPETNTAHCFLACGSFTPVKFVEMSKDLTRDDAIQFIFDLKDYRVKSPEEQWDALMNERPQVDRESLMEALVVFCARICADWEERQFEPETATLLSKCLGTLRAVKSPTQAEKWLTATKAVMRRGLEK